MSAGPKNYSAAAAVLTQVAMGAAGAAAIYVALGHSSDRLYALISSRLDQMETRFTEREKQTRAEIRDIRGELKEVRDAAYSQRR